MESGVTEFTSGTDLVLSYMPSCYDKEGVLAQMLSAFGEQLSQMQKIRENRVQAQFYVETAWERNLEKIGEGYINLYRHDDKDTRYRNRIKSMIKAPHGGTVATFTGVTLAQEDTGSFYELYKAKYNLDDGYYLDSFVRDWDETGEAGVYEFVTASGQTLGTSVTRLELLLERIQALGTQYQFASPLPCNRIEYTDHTGGWIVDTGDASKVPFAHNSGVTWYAIYTTGDHKIGYGTGALWVQYPSLSYANTGDIVVHRGFSTGINVVESGNTMMHFWTHVPAGISLSFVTGAGIYVFDDVQYQKQVSDGIITTGATIYYNTGSSYPLILTTGEYAIASPSYDNTGNLMAIYSFETDLVGDVPVDWTVGVGAVTVEQTFLGHTKVMKVPSGGNSVYQLFAAGGQNTGTIQFWVAVDAASAGYVSLALYGALGQTIPLYYNNGTFAYYFGGWVTLATCNPNTWYHVKVTWNASNWSFTLNGGTPQTGFPFSVGLPPIITSPFFNYDGLSDINLYVDAVDYSWDSATGNYQVPFFMERNRYFARDYGIPISTGNPFYGYHYNYYGYTLQSNGKGLGAIPTGWIEWTVNLHNFAKSGDTFYDCTGTYFDATYITGVQFRIAGNSGATTNIIFDGLSFEKPYSVTGSFI